MLYDAIIIQLKVKKANVFQDFYDFMRITAVVAEYNPLTLGHAYHLDAIRRETTPDALVVVMSGSFTERGDIAVSDKFTRAKCAIDAGADLVVELPAFYAVNCAEKFAEGAMKTLSIFGNVTVSFGSECGDLSKLVETERVISSETDKVKRKIREGLDLGKPFPAARADAFDDDIKAVLREPNNVLGIEYIKAGKAFGFNFHTVKRIGSFNGEDGLPSASFIRNALFINEKIDGLVPDYVLPTLSATVFNDSLSDMLLYRLSTMNTADIAALNDVSEGLENRISAVVKQSKTFDEILHNVKSKRYTAARIKRIFLYALFGLTKSLAAVLYAVPPYLRVLAVRKGKESLLNYAAEKTDNLIVRERDISRQTDSVKTALTFENVVDKVYAVAAKSELRQNAIFK
jgi:Predicted nucleotidyltransferase